MTVGAQQERRRALVIEDAPEYARVAVAVLERAGYAASVASSGESGLARARALEPHVLLVDVHLPGTDGLRVVRDLRSFTDAPIVVVSGRDDDVDVAAGLAAGADAYVTKPYLPAELAAEVAEAVARSTARPGLRRRAEVAR